MGMSRDDQAKEEHSRDRDTDEDSMSTREALERAQELAEQVEDLLTHLGQEVADSDTIRVRLARAHTLSLLDQLSELLGPRSSVARFATSYGPALPTFTFREDDEDTASGVRPLPAWR